MTCIVAFRDKTTGDIWFASESRASSPEHAITCATPKVGNFEGFTIGYAGSYRLGQMVLHSFTPPKHAPNIDVDDYMFTIWVESLKAHMEEYGIIKTENGVEGTDEAEIIIAYRGNIYCLLPDFALLKPLENFLVIGSGAPYATGVVWALENSSKHAPEEIVYLAVECAIQHSPGCGAPIYVFKHDPNSKAKPAKRKPREKKAALSQTASGSVAAAPDQEKASDTTPEVLSSLRRRGLGCK
jgi:ATP-dependent protease HslVU (ClpYQ) peptidase subunit